MSLRLNECKLSASRTAAGRDTSEVTTNDYWKLQMRLRLAPRSMTLDNLEVDFFSRNFAMKFRVVPACSTSRTSFASEDWVFSVTSPDFGVMYQQTRPYKSAPRRRMVSGLHRNGDAPVADHRPPEPPISAATRV